MIPYKQLTLEDLFSNCQLKFQHDKPAFLELLAQTLDLDEMVPTSFLSHFHSSTGRPRKYLLYPMLKVLLLQKIFFHRLVDLTEPICQHMNKEKASMLLFDTSGVEAFVTENNPKYANRIIKQLKS